MKQSLSRVLVALLAVLFTAAVHAQSIEVKNKDGTRWRGQVGDQVELTYEYQRLPVTITGTITKNHAEYFKIQSTSEIQSDRIVLKSDVISIKTLQPGSGEAPAAALPGGTSGGKPVKPTPGQEQPLGVFYMPLEGGVGQTFRHDEIDAIGREADKFGPGQIIVLHINSPGGLLIETELIHDSMEALKKRHRVVAWIKEAISAASATASHCHEIYFMRTGAMGAMTGFAGTRSMQGEELRKWMTAAGEWFESGGRSRYIAYAMIEDQAELSYDKDPVTGKVTWYPDLSGKVIMSRKGENLTFTATTAMESGFANGIADTYEELAKLLNLPKWHEINDSGRKIAASWKRTFEHAMVEIPKINARFSYKNRSTDQETVLRTQINLVEQLLDWWRKAPNACFLSGVPPKDELERILVEMRKILSDMRRR